MDIETGSICPSDHSGHARGLTSRPGTGTLNLHAKRMILVAFQDLMEMVMVMVTRKIW